MPQPPVTIYEVIPEPTAQTTILDVVFGGVAVVTALVGVAVVLGLGCAALLIGMRRMRRTRKGDDDAGDADVTRLGLRSS
jgi:hypothetical protein